MRGHSKVRMSYASLEKSKLAGLTIDQRATSTDVWRSRLRAAKETLSSRKLFYSIEEDSQPQPVKLEELEACRANHYWLPGCFSEWKEAEILADTIQRDIAFLLIEQRGEALQSSAGSELAMSTRGRGRGRGAKRAEMELPKVWITAVRLSVCMHAVWLSLGCSIAGP